MNIKTQRQIKNIKLGLQGGGSLGAYTAGVLCSILSDPTIKITEITGTSAGAMNGMIVAQTINKYGDNEEGRNTTKQRLVDFWNDVAHPPLPIGTKIMLDWVAAMAPHTTRYLITNSLLDHIKVHLQNPNALASGKIINLTIPAVDENGKERLFKNHEITFDALRASSSIQPHFHPVEIDGMKYIDGAYLGGSNPPIEPLTSNISGTDTFIFIMTNPPISPIRQRKQSDLSQFDVEHTEGLILHQAYDHIAYIMNQREKSGKSKYIPPIHIIWPNIEQPYTSLQKQTIDSDFISSLFKQGLIDGDNFCKHHSTTMNVRSSHSLNQLKKSAVYPSYSPKIKIA